MWGLVLLANRGGWVCLEGEETAWGWEPTLQTQV